MTAHELGQLEGSLEGLRALARSLVHGDADADDLLQDAAVAALEHPPRNDDDETGRAGSVRGWLAAVVRNRWRMDRRSAARRAAREQVAALEHASGTGAGTAEAGLDRARALERLSAALVALDEPFRTTVIRRYLDGQTAAQIARALGVPAGTVRWRLKTGLARLRAHLDQTTPRWQRALVLGLGATVKTKTSLALVVLVLVLIAAVAAVAWLGRAPAPTPVPLPTRTAASSQPHRPAAMPPAATPTEIAAPRTPRAVVEEASDTAGGVLSGRVINWSTGDGVVGAELTFTSDAGASTIRSQADGAFELAPPAPGRFVLTTIAAPGFLPYAPELLHSTVHVVLARDRVVRGVTVFLFPALDYVGTVVDGKGAPVAGARVRLLGTPSNEQAIDRPEIEWTSDRDGHFTFHAADDAVLEAQKGERRGWGRLDAEVAITKRMTIALGEFPARDATIRGRTVDARGNPIADVLVRASPAGRDRPTRSTSFATSGPDGAFAIRDLDRLHYHLAAEADGMAPATVEDVAAGADDVKITLDAGLEIAGRVVDPRGAPIPSYTLLVARRNGIVRELMVARSIVDPRGAFSVRVEKGDYELTAAGRGWAPSAPTVVPAGTTDVTIALSAGGALRGRVVASDTRTPVVHARIMREANGGGASAQPSNAGTVTDADGNFELTGIPAGPLSIAIAAADFHGKIEAGMTASDGGSLGPITIALDRLAAGEAPSTELVGIGATLAARDDTLEVMRVFAGSGAEAAGIVVGDRIIEIDGAPVAPLGVDGAIAKIRGVAGTALTVTVRRNDAPVKLLVQRRKLKA